MTIDSVQSQYFDYSAPTASNSSASSESFTISDGTQKVEKTKKEIEAAKSDEEIKAFFKKMKEAGNALTYVVKSNLEKIKQLIEEKKEELKKASGFYSEPPLSPEAKAEAMKGIEKALDEYKKELMKELEDKSKAEKESTQKTTGLKSFFAS